MCREGALTVEGLRAMSIRVGLLLLLAGIALAPLRASAQTCTIGPLTSSTSMSALNSQINSAPNGAVVCLQRGQTWSSGSGLVLTSSHPDTARVTICGASGTQCTPAGTTPNPRF